MTERLLKAFETLRSAESFGKEVLDNGTLLLGDMSEVVGLAWFHHIFPPISTKGLGYLQKQIGPLHKDLRASLEIHNGMVLFAGKLALYGHQASIDRGKKASDQPFDIVGPYLYERPRNTPAGIGVIGGYSADGSCLMIDSASGVVYRSPRKNWVVISQWPNWEEMFCSEVERLSQLFDSRGRPNGEGVKEIGRIGLPMPDWETVKRWNSKPEKKRDELNAPDE